MGHPPEALLFYCSALLHKREVVCLISSSIFFIEYYIHFFVYMLNLSSLNISHFLI